MVTRSVTVRLRADISSYTRGMRQAADNTSRLANAGAAVGTVLVAGFAVAAAAAAKFDKALSNVRAVTGASAADMEKLRAAALEAGKTTAFSAYEAADAEAELARAGVAVADIVGGALKGSLALAAAGQVDLAESATIAAQAMNTFNLNGADVAHVADLLAAGANKSAADVHGLGMSLRMGGLLAHQTGLSIEDTVGVLAAFADHALIGSDAGTSLKVMLQRLVPQSKEAAGMMERLGFTAYDSAGQFVGLTELSQRLKTSFGKLTPEARNAAFATIFGADAVRSATILYELGAEGVNEYINAVDDQGAATRMASIQMDNLIGDLHKLKGAIEVALIEGGSAAQGALRGMTQWVTRLVNAYNDLPTGLQHTVTLLGGVTGAAVLAGSAFLLLIPRIAATRLALQQMGLTAVTARNALMMVGRLSLVVGGLAAVSFGISKLNEALREPPPNVTKLTNSLIDLVIKGKAAGELSKTFGKDLDGVGEAAARLAHPGVLDRIGDALYTITHLGMDEDAGLQEARDQINSLDEALASLVSSGAPDVAAKAFNRMAKEAEANGTSTEKLRTLLPQYTEALVATDTQAQLNAESQKALGDATATTADQLKDERTEAEKLSDALSELNGVAISTAEREISFRESLANLTETVKENGRSLDVTSEKGRKVKSAFLDAAKAAMEHAEAVSEQKGSMQAGQAVLQKDIELLRKQMEAAGFSTDAINTLTAAYARLPEKESTTVTAPGAVQAAKEIDNLYKEVSALQPGKTVVIKAPTAEAVKALRAAGYAVKEIPGSKNVQVTAPTGTAQANVGALRNALDGLKNKTISVTTMYFQQGRPPGPYADGYQFQGRAQGGLIRGFAAGGLIGYPGGGLVRGPGTDTSDSILARVSKNEFVMKAAAVRHYGIGLMSQLNAMQVPAGSMSRGSLLSAGRFAPSQAETAAAMARALGAQSEGGTFQGDLYLDSGQFLGAVSGVVRPIVRESEQRQAHRAKVGRR